MEMEVIQREIEGTSGVKAEPISGPKQPTLAVFW